MFRHVCVALGAIRNRAIGLDSKILPPVQTALELHRHKVTTVGTADRVRLTKYSSSKQGPLQRGGDRKFDVFFSGCSWLCMYHIGVAQSLHEQKVPVRSYSGASSGSLVAVALASGIKPKKLRTAVTRIAEESRKHILGPLSRLSSILAEGLDSLLPGDAHETCSGRLEVSVTPVWTFEDGVLNNWRVNTFESRKELIDCIVASCAIVPTFYKKHLCFDGGLWYNYARQGRNVLVVNHRVMEGHISPSDALTTSRIWAPSPDMLNEIYLIGYRDAEKWMQRRTR